MRRFMELLTLCGLTSQKTQRGGPGLGGSVHEEAHPCFPCFVQLESVNKNVHTITGLPIKRILALIQ